MSTTTPAEQALRDGDLPRALKLLTEQVRAKPQDAKLRVFMFQLLCVVGQWDRALNQLNVSLELDASTLPMVQTYREAIACETLRMQVFKGQKVPMLFGEPENWTALFIEAMLRDGRGEPGAAAQLREQALEQAPTSRGQIDGQPFEWIADADTRLGPMLEVVINGKYYWLPWNRLTQVDIDPPQDLRDAVWMPAHFQFTNGGEVVGLIPTRYPDTDLQVGDRLSLARSTDWRETSPGFCVGLGQRLIVTDQAEFGLMDLRSVTIEGEDRVGASADVTAV
jgi:type VI secretion system protein ImpE